MSGRIVVTGVGAVGSWGASAEELRDLLASDRALLSPLPPLGELPRRRGLTLDPRVAWAGRVPAEALAPWISGGEARRMSFNSKLAVAAARIALAGAGIAPQPLRPEATEGNLLGAAVVLATAFGPSSVTEELIGQIALAGAEAASPALFSESVANAPAAQVARLVGARGANLTFTGREAGGLQAILRAAAEVAAGRASLALAGVVDEMTPLLQAVFDHFGAVARGGRSHNGAPGSPPVARPFDRRRTGFLTGEGSAILVLEEEAAAAARGARALARVAGGGGAFDPTAPRAGWGEGHEALAAALRRILARSGVALESIDLIVAGASGARAGDRLEAHTLRAAWGERALPPVVAPKGVTGELGGGQLGAAMAALDGARFGPTAGFRKPDPALGLVPHSGGPFPRPVRRLLVSALAVGGPAAWLVLDRPEAEA